VSWVHIWNSSRRAIGYTRISASGDVCWRTSKTELIHVSAQLRALTASKHVIFEDKLVNLRLSDRYIDEWKIQRNRSQEHAALTMNIHGGCYAIHLA
jgi:hypothetical protein